MTLVRLVRSVAVGQVSRSEIHKHIANYRAGHRDATQCLNCARRNDTCHFSEKLGSRRRGGTSLQHVPSIGIESNAGARLGDEPRLHHDNPGQFSGMSKYNGLQELYVDRLLMADDHADAVVAQSPSLQDLGVFGKVRHSSYGLS